MRKLLFLCSLLIASQGIFSQGAFQVSYEQLKEYEGLYEYLNHSTLKIAASPKDTLLYAVINESRYKLVPVGRDEFLDMSKNKVLFVRNASSALAGYMLGSDTFKLIDKNVFFPRSIWYPRLPLTTDFKYVYQQPKDLGDGLETGVIKNSGLNPILLDEMMRKIVDGTYPNVHSILIIKDGRLVFEEYFYEYNKDSLHELRSATKSIVSALTGIAIQQRLINSENDPVISFFPEYNLNNNTAGKKRITIRHLLTNQSGLDCDISNDKSEGNEMKMGYSNDWVKFTLDLPMVDSPGGKGMYCSGNVITLGRIVEKATKQYLPDFAKKNLFTPMGVSNIRWSFKPDPSSAETFCQIYMRPRDMAKFGLLYLNKGKWHGKQILAHDWVMQSLAKHSTVQNVDYGYLWWIKYLDADGVRYYGKAAQGNGGQKIYIWEEQNMVTVIRGGNYNTQSPSDELIRKYFMPSFNKK